MSSLTKMIRKYGGGLDLEEDRHHQPPCFKCVCLFMERSSDTSFLPLRDLLIPIEDMKTKAGVSQVNSSAQ